LAALSRSADQFFLVLFTEQGRRHPTKKGDQLGFLFGRSAVKQFGQALLAGGSYCSDGLLPGSSQLELAIYLTLHWCCRGDQSALSQRFNGRHQPDGRHVELLRQSRPKPAWPAPGNGTGAR